MKETFGLVAHDEKKQSILNWVKVNIGRLREVKIYATGTTGGMLKDACPELDITPLKSGPHGGDQQIGALIADQKMDALIFFIDPLSPHPHDVDVKALFRLATLYNIPFASNQATADLVIKGYRK